MHPAAPHHLPFFIPGADGSDTLMVVMGIFLVATVLWVGTLYWKLHSLPERMAHKSQKLQFEIVAVLGLISLFTHMHIFWVAGLFMLPRFYVYHQESAPGSDEEKRWIERERKLRKIIITPAMSLVWIFGLLLAYTISAWSQPWFLAKFAIVAAVLIDPKRDLARFWGHAPAAREEIPNREPSRSAL